MNCCAVNCVQFSSPHEWHKILKSCIHGRNLCTISQIVVGIGTGLLYVMNCVFLWYLLITSSFLPISAAVWAGFAGTFTRREPASPVMRTRRLMKRPTAQHGGARKERDDRMGNYQSHALLFILSIGHPWDRTGDLWLHSRTRIIMRHTITLFIDTTDVCPYPGCPSWTIHRGHLSEGGRAYEKYSNVSACLKYCEEMSACLAVDFDGDTGCWLHTNPDDLMVRKKVDWVCTQYVINRTCMADLVSIEQAVKNVGEFENMPSNCVQW